VLCPLCRRKRTCGTWASSRLNGYTAATMLCLLLRGHADAGIGDGELDETAAIADLACRKLDLARFGELAGIAEEIEQDLPQPHGIDGRCSEVLWSVNDEAVLVLLGKLSGGADDVVDQRF